eukprot:RCo037831
MHFLYDSEPIVCPSWNFPMEGTPLLTSVLTAMGLLFAITTLVWYNSLTLHDMGQHTRITQTTSVCNTLWVMYFLMLFMRWGVEDVRVSLGPGSHHSGSPVGLYLTLGGLVLEGLVVFLLTLSLDYQRKFRKGDYLRLEQFLREEHYEGHCGKIVQSVALCDLAFLLLAVLYLACTLLSVNDELFSEPWSYWLYVSTGAVQFLPVVVLAGLICAAGVTETYLGPSRGAKAALLVGVLLSLPGVLPLSFWRNFAIPELPFTGGCVMAGLSAYDLVLACKAAAQALFFVFVRSEYLRNLEQETFLFYQQCQDYMNLHQF